MHSELGRDSLLVAAFGFYELQDDRSHARMKWRRGPEVSVDECCCIPISPRVGGHDRAEQIALMEDQPVGRLIEAHFAAEETTIRGHRRQPLITKMHLARSRLATGEFHRVEMPEQ
jgi:hypothetical protein